MNLNIKIVFSIILLIILSACGSKNIQKPTEQLEKPEWIIHPNSLDASLAVGSSNKNFKGVSAQLQNAVNQGKNELSHSIKTTINSKFKQEIKINNSVAANRHSQIEDISNAFLKNSYQLDAFFDNNGKLFVLMYSPELHNMQDNSSFNLKSLNTTPFSNKKLLNSKCYNKEIRESITTQANIFQGKPEWFFRPNVSGKIGSIGIAEKFPSEKFEDQKKRAIILAKSSYSKQIHSKIKSKYEILQIIKHDVSGEIFETSSTITSANKISELKLQDIWIDPESCELYIFFN